jgi:predicted transposase YdaD
VTVYIPEHSPWAQNLYRKGQAEGRAEGHAEGEAEGRARGRAEGEAIAVLNVLRRRGIEVPPEQHRQISTCTDTHLLELWLDRAIDATHIDDLFDDAAGAVGQA